MRDLFKSGSVAQFLIHGNLFDIVPARWARPGKGSLPLKTFLDEVMFESYEIVMHYDRGRGDPSESADPTTGGSG